MGDIHYHIARVLSIVFIIGVAGCAIAIPIVAVKFGMVLFEKEHEELGDETPEDTPAQKSQKS